MVKYVLLTLALISLGPQGAGAAILFEGYYRIENKGQHIGYLVQRLATDSGGNKILTAYIRMRDEGGAPGDEVYESYKSVAKAGSGTPVSASFESTRAGEKDTVNTEFDKKGFAQIVEVNKTRGQAKTRKDTSVGAPFLSSMIFFMTDFGKMKEGKYYNYDAYVEERGHVSEGVLFYAGQRTAAGLPVVHVADNFMGQSIEGFLAPTGEALGSRSWSGESITFWVDKREDAIGSFKFPTAELTRLFGDLPEARKNPWAKVKPDAVAVIKSFVKPNIPRPKDPKTAPKLIPLPRRKL